MSCNSRSTSRMCSIAFDKHTSVPYDIIVTKSQFIWSYVRLYIYRGRRIEKEAEQWMKGTERRGRRSLTHIQQRKHSEKNERYSSWNETTWSKRQSSYYTIFTRNIQCNQYWMRHKNTRSPSGRLDDERASRFWPPGVAVFGQYCCMRVRTMTIYTPRLAN